MNSTESEQALAQLKTTWAGVTSALQQTWNAVAPILASIHDALWKAYREADMPYGNSHEGFMKWLADQSEIQRLYSEIERLKQHHQLLIDARKLGEEIRARRR